MDRCSLLAHDLGLRDAWGKPQAEPSPRWERWTYDLPRLVLRHRVEIPPPAPVDLLARVVTPSGSMADLWRRPVDEGRATETALVLDRTIAVPWLVDSDAEPLPPALTEKWQVASARSSVARCSSAVRFSGLAREPPRIKISANAD